MDTIESWSLLVTSEIFSLMLVIEKLCALNSLGSKLQGVIGLVQTRVHNS